MGTQGLALLLLPASLEGLCLVGPTAGVWGALRWPAIR